MYVRVTDGTSDPSRLDDVLTVLRDAGLPMMHQQAGFQDGYIGVNRETGRVVVVSTWDTGEHANVSFAAATELLSRLQALNLQVEQPEVYEVAG